MAPSPHRVHELIVRVYAGNDAAHALAGSLAGARVAIRGATGDERRWLETALTACAAEIVSEHPELVVAGSLATRADRHGALTTADVEAIWTVLGALRGLAVAPAPSAQPLLRAA